MKINKITPQGYCGGVKHALQMVYQLLEDSNTKKPIYMLGSIIHNSIVIDDLTKKGIILIENKNKTRLELLDEIKEGTVIFSAHGVSPKVHLKALQKGLTILDTTCKNVEIVHQNIKKYLDLGYTCLYIGTKNHPECEGVLGIDSRIQLIENCDNINSNYNTPIYITNQTTLSIDDTKEIYDIIKEQYPNAIIDNKICNATTIRQQAMKAQEKVDLCLVVGDQHSSNTKKLVEVSQKEGIPTILVENLKDIQSLDLKNIKSISISSGASTPDIVVNDIINYLKNGYE